MYTDQGKRPDRQKTTPSGRQEEWSGYHEHDEIQQGGSIQKMRQCAVFCMRKPMRSIGFQDPIGVITFVISPRVPRASALRKGDKDHDNQNRE